MNIKYILPVFFVFALLHSFHIWATFSSGRFATLDLNKIETVLIAIELILVVFVILIAISALFGFWMIKDAAIQAAIDEAKKISLEKSEDKRARENELAQSNFIKEAETEEKNPTDTDSND